MNNELGSLELVRNEDIPVEDISVDKFNQLYKGVFNIKILELASSISKTLSKKGDVEHDIEIIVK